MRSTIVSTSALALSCALASACSAPVTSDVPAEATASSGQALTNLLGDPDFEGQVATSPSSPWFAGGGASMEINAGRAEHGRNAARVSASSGWNAINQWVSVKKFTRYRVGGWFRTSVDVKDAYVSIRGNPSETSSAVIAEVHLGTIIGEYSFAEYEFDSGANDSVLFYAGYFSPGAGSWLEADDLFLQPAPNQVLDGDFEGQATNAVASPWSGAGPTGIDRGAGQQHAGSNEAWAHATSGWSAVNQWVTVTPNTSYHVSGWFRTSPNATGLYFSVRGNPSQTSSNVINEVGFGALPGTYAQRSFDFNSGANTSVLLYGGLWGNGADAWMQMDDVAINPTFTSIVPVPVDTTPPAGGAPGLVKAYTEHLGKLTDTPTNDIQHLGMKGFDLGVSFQSTGGLAFLFGDTWPIDSADWLFDSAALTSATSVRRDQMPALSWFTRPGSASFAHFTMPGVSFGGMEVPMEGLAIGARNYVFAMSGWNATTNTDTLLALGHVDGTNLSSVTTDFSVATTKFTNVSVGVSGSYVYVWGTGKYRASPVYLARVPTGQLADHSAWRYFRGRQSGVADFGPGEDTAAQLVPIACGGEISVRRHPASGLWLMTYNCDSPRGINLRTAPSPTGPWSDPIVAFDPWGDGGYERFMHAPVSWAGFDDGLSNWWGDAYETWGGEYGPYMVPQWFWTEAPGVFHVVYTMSSWNPYQVHLIDTVLTTPGVKATRPVRGAGLAKATLVNGDFASWDIRGWQTQGSAPGVFRGADGTPHVTTFVNGDAATGRMWQDFAIDATTTKLSFRVHGGSTSLCAVKLVRVSTGEVLRAVHGRDTNAPEQAVEWNLEDYRGATVRLMIEDENGAGPWGFIGTSGFTLE